MHKILSLAVLLIAATAQAASSPTALVGPGVGNVDLLVTQGLKDYNAKNYEAARDDFLKSLRAKPDNSAVYLSLARSYLQTKQIALACWTYRVFIKNNPSSPDRDKAQAELDNCQRQQASLSPVPPDPGLAFVDQKAAFQQAAEDGKLVGPASASAILGQMLKDGYAAPDLADMASKLRGAAETAANAGFSKAMNHEAMNPAELRQVGELYQLAQDVGATDATYAPKVHFVNALADLQEHKFGEAEKGFDKSLGAGSDKEAKFYGAVAVYRSGDHRRALQLLKKELPEDPRTKILETDSALAADPQKGAQDLEKLLFDQRFKSP